MLLLLLLVTTTVGSAADILGPSDGMMTVDKREGWAVRRSFCMPSVLRGRKKWPFCRGNIGGTWALMVWQVKVRRDMRWCMVVPDHRYIIQHRLQ